jgi:tetratricopeptide (TPR) repeat protein
MRRLCIAALLALTGLAPVMAAPVNLWYEQANRFYQQNQFDSAEVYYRKIVDSGLQNAAIFYNLGNCCFRLNHVGQAILFWERAARLDPTDRDIAHNLRFARANIVDRIPEPQLSFFGTVLKAFHGLLPLRTQLWVLCAMLFVLCGLFIAGLWASRNARLWLTYLGVLLLVMMGSLGASAGVKIAQLERVRQAVVLKPSIDALNGPSGDRVLFTAHEGTTFRVRDTREGWVLVSLPNGVSGWVEVSALGEI